MTSTIRILVLFVLALFAVTVQAQELEPVELTYLYPGAVPADIDLVEAALNDILSQRINATVDLQPMDWGAFEERATLMLASGETCDLVYTAPWINNYWQRVAAGAFLPLDDLLPEFAPGTWASMPEEVWSAARATDGSIYGVINQHVFPRVYGVAVNIDSAAQYDFDLDTVDTLDDLDPLLQAIVDNEGIVPLYTDDLVLHYFAYSEFFGFDPLLLDPYVVVKADDPQRQVLNYAATDEFRQAVETSYRWNQAGYMYPEPYPADLAWTDFQAGTFKVIVDVITPDLEPEYRDQYNMNVRAIPIAPAYMTTNGTISSITALCATSPNPERALMFVELLNTDPEIYNLLAKGIEGVHWEWVDEERQLVGYPEGVTAETTGYAPNTDWMFGNQFNSYYISEGLVGTWDATEALNASAIPSVALGFSVDTEPILTEIAQVSAVIEELGGPLTYGMVNPETGIPDLIQRMDEAGMQTILAEVQRQIDAWAAARS